MKKTTLWAFAILVVGIVGCADKDPIRPSDETSSTSVKILAAETGFYHIDVPQLQNAGLEISDFEGESINLSQAGEAVPYSIVEDRIVFYGQAPDSRYTSTRPYILTVGGEEGDAGIQMTEVEMPAIGGDMIETLPRTIHFEQNAIYRSQARTDRYPDLVPWFWQEIRVESQATVEVDLPAQSDGGGSVTLQMWGVSHNAEVENDHDIHLEINDVPIGIIVGEGKRIYSATLEIPAGTLRSGANTILLDNTPPGATFLDINFLDWLEISFNAPLQASQDQFVADAGISGQAVLRGFGKKPLLFDIANPNQPAILTGWEYENESASLSIAAETKLAGVSQDGFKSAIAISPMRMGNLRDTAQQADLIIIADDALISPMTDLIEARKAQGLSVIVAPIMEIYDQFGFGEESPKHITSFLAYAAEQWQTPAPKYLLVVGDATYDYQDNLGLMPPNAIPAPIVPVDFSGETISDSRLTDFDGDFAPNMAVGRWPLSDPNDVAELVERTLAYETDGVSARALFSAELHSAKDVETSEFTNFTDNLIVNAYVPDEQIVKLYGKPADELVSNWGDGAWLVTFTGHGGASLWGNDDVLTLDAFEELQGNAKPIVLQFTCLTGFFHDPNITSITEVMLRHDNGPILLVGATSLTLSANQSPFAINLLRAIQDPEMTRMGDAFQHAKLELDVEMAGRREISDTFLLFGDPTAVIQRPNSAQSAVSK